MGLAGEENSSIFAPALRHNEGCGVEWEVHYILGDGDFLRRLELKKIKVKKLIFLLARIKKKSKIFLKKIWRIKKKHCIFAAAYSANKFPEILKRNPGWVR